MHWGVLLTCLIYNDSRSSRSRNITKAAMVPGVGWCAHSHSFVTSIAVDWHDFLSLTQRAGASGLPAGMSASDMGSHIFVYALCLKALLHFISLMYKREADVKQTARLRGGQRKNGSRFKFVLQWTVAIPQFVIRRHFSLSPPEFERKVTKP